MIRPVELISTGSELLSGRTVNGHAQTLGEILRPLGLNLVRDTTVGDEIETIADALRGALGRADFVFISGGLGPTSDDLTRDAVAEVLGRRVVMDASALEALHERYARFGRTVSPESERQALVVEGAAVLLNPVGIAPGERLDLERRTLFVLPGPPGEFRGVVETHIVPWLRENAGAMPAAERILMVSGVGESDVVTTFEGAGFPGAGIDIGYCAGPGRVEVRLSVAGNDAARLDEAVLQAHALLGDHIFADERIEIEEVVLRLLADCGQLVATAEFGTDGLLAGRFSLAPSGPGTFLGGVVANHPDVLADVLGLNPEEIETHGAASKPVAVRMAAAARIHHRADIGLALSGFASRGEDQPGGALYAALDDRAGRTAATRFRLSGGRERMTTWAVQNTLDWLRRTLAAKEKGSRKRGQCALLHSPDGGHTGRTCGGGSTFGAFSRSP